MRLVECLTIRIKDIDLQERIIETGFIKNARKSTGMTRKILLFFVPKNFIPYLRQYINYIKRKYNTPWLFSGQSIIKPLTKNIRLYVKRNYDNNKIQYSLFHSFRKTLISRFDNTLGMQPHIREILLNHQPTTTQGKAYIKKEPEVKRKDYDRFFPYYHFPYF